MARIDARFQGGAMVDDDCEVEDEREVQVGVTINVPLPGGGWQQRVLATRGFDAFKEKSGAIQTAVRESVAGSSDTSLWLSPKRKDKTRDEMRRLPPPTVAVAMEIVGGQDALTAAGDQILSQETPLSTPRPISPADRPDTPDEGSETTLTSPSTSGSSSSETSESEDGLESYSLDPDNA
jgi:hypothetical protein